MPTGFAVSTRLPLLKKLGTVLVWVNAAGPLTGDGDGADWGGYTIRQIIDTSVISNTGKTYVRVTFESSSVQAMTIAAAYIEHAAAAGDPYDFATTPTELKFSGASGFAIAAGTQIVSDQTPFSIQAGKNLVISYYVSGDASHDDIRRKLTQTGWSGYWKLANDPTTVNATGYTGPIAVAALGVMRVAAADAYASG